MENHTGGKYEQGYREDRPSQCEHREYFVESSGVRYLRTSC